MKILGIIPARYASTRFPGKPLVSIGGKSMIQRVYEQVKKAEKITDVVVATDDTRIKNVITGLGGKCIMTSEMHQTGTERCAEAYALLKADYDYIINIQGDEPFIDPEVINELCELLDYKTEIATVVKRIKDQETLLNPNVVKVVLTMRKQALYFSRQTIPYVRGVEQSEWLDHAEFYKHIGIYAYRSDVLEQIVKLPLNVLENTEKLEQLRWLGYGYRIMASETNYESLGIDTPEDLEKLNFDNK
ncbi:3-deoxy-manno-octulosonate cytidylyltransferase [Jiulongibacter sediminis]|uniref:3-deoxy-manno-octulosonate cytidylyltransferase n=1 Tax=Jiulongibacter sediminis TaxID=1605367 RepID=A0A0P7C697_9BACT|nr:3-deoxy-manno-octulosonate cytidylyltransferase [Jiulongibacter sediminis]KPM49822.1 3-deoxy-manno-octulosonate cytidylyltransferase [Jiulongibacter sediminis]TBX26859.1 3-deoxy-manno-octulosonate cytidylyltransferase [Jiulongibacter sediminis]